MSILNDIVYQDAPLLEAVALWADAAARVRDDFAATVPVLEAASVRAPRNTQLLGLLAWANLAKGDKAKARYFYNRIILVSPDERERLWAQKRADSAELTDGVESK